MNRVGAAARADHSLVRVPKTAELVARHIRRQIVRGELAEGEVLPPEAELMQRFGVSRPTLREAYRVLESESLISIQRGSRGGARVRLPDSRVAGRYAGLVLQLRGTTLDDVFEARAVIEPPAARFAAQRRTPDSVERLRAAITVESAVVDDPIRFAMAASAFHETLMEESGNDTMAVLHGTLAEIVATTTTHVVVSSVDQESRRAANELAVRSHCRLVDLIEQGDGEGAESHWRAHMEHVRRRFNDRYGVRTFVDLFS
jgi:GntR family transcriptional regulator, transcriptional repressor for pyruvate dehydrogenase complex